MNSFSFSQCEGCIKDEVCGIKKEYKKELEDFIQKYDNKLDNSNSKFYDNINMRFCCKFFYKKVGTLRDFGFFNKGDFGFFNKEYEE